MTMEGRTASEREERVESLFFHLKNIGAPVSNFPLTMRPTNRASKVESNGEQNGGLWRAFVSGHKENEEGRPMNGAS